MRAIDSLKASSLEVARRTLRFGAGYMYRWRRNAVLPHKRRHLVPDLDAYRPVFKPWELERVRLALRVADTRSLVSPDRKYLLLQFLRQAVTTCEGDVAECGVYKGGTAYLLAQELARLAVRRSFYLLDTFEGMPQTHEHLDLHREGDFADTSLTSVQKYLAEFENLEFVSGYIPASLSNVPHKPFSFVHIDLDIHDAIVSASDFFYPLIPRGGFIVYDDYGFASCPGARRAVDDFYAARPEVPIILPTGQCVIFKA